MNAKLTIGMAVYDDFDGAYFTIQSLREYHPPELIAQCAVMVVDNNPAGRPGQRVRDFLAWGGKDLASLEYVPYTERTGTAAPRDLVFRRARTPYVMCVDSHVLLRRGALQALFDYYARHPNTRNLISGPMYYDNRITYSTHFTDVWRHGMWGVWGDDDRVVTHPDETFEIGAQGLGLFTCRKDMWEKVGGFNPAFNGFGGEEWYIHTKFRQAGAKCLCLPKLGWIHRFNEGATYPRTSIQKVRNYVIGHKECGLPLDRVYRHFVEGINEDGSSWDNDGTQPSGTDIRKSNVISEAQWTLLIADPTPEASAVEQPRSQCGTCNQTAEPLTLDQLYRAAADSPSDINEHAQKLRELASKVESVTEFGMRHGVSTVAMLAGQPKRFTTIAANQDPIVKVLQSRHGATAFEFKTGNSLTTEIEETDLLFLDTRHTADHLYAELTRHAPKVRRWIALHDTQIFGEQGEDGGPGLLPALRRFMQERPEWSVIYDVMNNHGFTVISRDPADKPALPGLIEKGTNFAKALGAHVMDQGKTVAQATMQTRLEICLTCPHRNNEHCSRCG